MAELKASLYERSPVGLLLTTMNAVHAANPDAILVAPEERDALFAALDVYALALEEIAEVPGRSVTSIIARRALDGLR